MPHASPGTPVTRGHGLLEGLLSKLRARRADALIPDHLRTGALLDIGCGSFPYFLTHTRFARRVGIDKSLPADRCGRVGPGDLTLLRHDFTAAEPLPFPDASFDVVTMLAVFEHIDLPVLRVLLGEVNRVLRPGGRYVLTTPNAWTPWLLDLLKNLRLVSHEEIDEHKGAYGPRDIAAVIETTALAGLPRRAGTFELGVNVWACVEKPALTDAQTLRRAA